MNLLSSSNPKGKVILVVFIFLFFPPNFASTDPMPMAVEALFDDNTDRDIIQFDNKVEEGSSANVEQTVLLEYVDKHILEVAKEREASREMSQVRIDI